MGAIVPIVGAMFCSIMNLRKKLNLVDLCFLMISIELLILHQARSYFLAVGVCLIITGVLCRDAWKPILITVVTFILMAELTSVLLHQMRENSLFTDEVIKGVNQTIENMRILKFSDSDTSITSTASLMLQGISETSEENSKVYSGSAGGLHQRLEWWRFLIGQGLSTPKTIFLGLGYGADLGFWHVVREPHNVLVSVFSRGGALLLFSGHFFAMDCEAVFPEPFKTH